MHGVTSRTKTHEWAHFSEKKQTSIFYVTKKTWAFHSLKQKMEENLLYREDHFHGVWLAKTVKIRKRSNSKSVYINIKAD